jgi:UDP-3-O-[3-hydroxymyristoyl] glucosamine N-acyltransferase
MSKFSAEQIAALLGGTVEGDSKVIVTRLSRIEEGEPGSLSFLSNPLYTPFLYTTRASIVIVSVQFQPEAPLPEGCTLIRVQDPRAGFATLLEAYDRIKKQRSGIEQPSVIAATATYGEGFYLGAFSRVGENVRIGKNVQIHANCIIGDKVKIGDNSILFAGVKVYDECIIGSDCRIHAGVVIGSDGFGFVPNSENNYRKVPQTGNVVIEDHVEIGSNTTVDRATLGSTIIRKGVKLDNLIQVAHNVEIGENTVIAAQTGISGSTRIGKNCMIGGQVGIVGHITIGDNVKIAAQSGISHSLADGELAQGSPAINAGTFKRSFVVFKNLAELSQSVRKIEKKLNGSVDPK